MKLAIGKAALQLIFALDSEIGEKESLGLWQKHQIGAEKKKGAT